MAAKWIPNYIKRKINYRPKDILTAQEYNAILNLLITQGDYNSAWLDYLQTDAIPEAIAEIGMEEIEEALTEAVRQELDALAHEVNNKTSKQLNNPAITILNTGLQITPWLDFADLIGEHDLKATYCIATNLIGYSSAYPTLNQIQNIKAAGNDIVAYSTDGAAVTELTADTVAEASKRYMEINELNSNVFVYPSGNSDEAVTDIVHNYFKYAINIINNSAITPDGIVVNAPASVLGNIPVVNCNNTIDTTYIKGYIDNVVEHNKYMILCVNTDSEHYDSAQLEEILDYIATKSSIQFPPTISDEMLDIHTTIGNLLALVDGIIITEVDGEKYLNW